MKLTNTIRDAFVRAVMDDVPSVDYDEMAREAVTKWAINRMPADVKKFYKSHPEWVNTGWAHTPSGFSNFSIPCEQSGARLVAEISEVLDELVKQKREQQRKRDEISRNVRASIYSCSTRKQAIERLPEFEKYLPKDEKSAIDRTMPVIANLVADLTAAGWPKSA